jgi:transcriptional antiterminator RfaH
MQLDAWFAVHTRSKAEPVVERLLLAKGYETFLPLARISDKRAWPASGRPLFPGYLFCQVTKESKGLIASTPGVLRLLSFGGSPIAIDASEIDALRRVNSTLVAREECSWLPTGTQVVVTNGSLAGLRGLVVDTMPKRLILSVTLMQRSVRVTIDPCVTIVVATRSQ